MPPNSARYSPRKRTVLLFLGAVVLLFWFMEESEEAVRDALNLCAHILIPSLFPFMVISSLFVQWGIAEPLCRPLASVFRRYFHLPECAASAVFLGAVCGFPVGAKTACELYRQGELSREETERLIAAANNTGPSFVVEVIGAYYWNSRGFGIFLYVVQILSALGIARLMAKRHKLPPLSVRQKRPLTYSAGNTFAEAVSSSAQAVLGICGFVAFFSAVLSICRMLLSAAGMEAAIAVLAAVLEFSSGCAMASSAGGLYGAFLTGFAVGWSGLSVFAQSCLFTAETGLSLRLAAISKLLQGVICGSGAVFWAALFTPDPAARCTVFPDLPFPDLFLIAEILMLMFFCVCPSLFSMRRKVFGKHRSGR